MKPNTRKEAFMMKHMGFDVACPEPITREEMILANAPGGSGGGQADDKAIKLYSLSAFLGAIWLVPDVTLPDDILLYRSETPIDFSKLSDKTFISAITGDFRISTDVWGGENYLYVQECCFGYEGGYTQAAVYVNSDKIDEGVAEFLADYE